MNLPTHPPTVILAPSPVHGLGVFAVQDIPANTCLGQFIGEEYSLKDFKQKYNKDTSFCYHLGRQNKILVAKENRNWITYINESKTPNVCLKQRGCWTLCPILAGQELFLQYDKKGIIKYPRDYLLLN